MRGVEMRGSKMKGGNMGDVMHGDDTLGDERERKIWNMIRIKQNGQTIC